MEWLGVMRTRGSSLAHEYFPKSTRATGLRSSLDSLLQRAARARQGATLGGVLGEARRARNSTMAGPYYIDPGLPWCAIDGRVCAPTNSTRVWAVNKSQSNGIEHHAASRRFERLRY